MMKLHRLNRKPRYNDDEIKNIVKANGIMPIKDLTRITGYPPPVLRKKIRRIPAIRRLKFTIGYGNKGRGGTLGNTFELFDGFSYKLSGKWLYVAGEEERAAEILASKLQLSPQLPKYHRMRLTQYFKEILPPELFRQVYANYSYEQ